MRTLGGSKISLYFPAIFAVQGTIICAYAKKLTRRNCGSVPQKLRIIPQTMFRRNCGSRTRVQNSRPAEIAVQNSIAKKMAYWTESAACSASEIRLTTASCSSLVIVDRLVIFAFLRRTWGILGAFSMARTRSSSLAAKW